jgi:hypothetical protein
MIKIEYLDAQNLDLSRLKQVKVNFKQSGFEETVHLGDDNRLYFVDWYPNHEGIKQASKGGGKRMLFSCDTAEEVEMLYHATTIDDVLTKIKISYREEKLKDLI